MIPADSTFSDAPPTRIGDETLSMFANPSRAAVLQKLSQASATRSDLIHQTGIAVSTLDAHLSDLCSAGLVERRRSDGFPARSELSMAAGRGQDLAPVLHHVALWQRHVGFEPTDGLSPRMSRMIQLVSWAWHSRLIDRLAGGRLGITELVRQMPEFSHRAVETKVRELIDFGLVEPAAGRRAGRAKPLRLTTLGNRLLGPLAAIVRWELRHQGGGGELLKTGDVVTAFHMAFALIDSTLMEPGLYTFGVVLQEGECAAITVQISDRGVEALRAGLDRRAKHWSIGRPDPWLDAVLDHRLPVEGRQTRRDLKLTRSARMFFDLLHGQVNAGAARTPPTTRG